jgi:hypothetical protein
MWLAQRYLLIDAPFCDGSPPGRGDHRGMPWLRCGEIRAVVTSAVENRDPAANQ